MNMYEILRNLCLAPAPSGYEKNAAKIFAAEVTKYADYVYLDKMGSVIAKIEGTDPQAPIVMAYAHLDQLGFIVRKINRDGYLQVDRLGGIPEKVLPALRLAIRTKNGDFIPGVFGNKAHHAASDDEKYKVDVVTSLYIDIGASSEQEARDLGVDIGCPIIYEPSFSRLGKDKVCGTALDDRGGLAALLYAANQLSEHRPACTVYIVGTVWEEFNIRGAVFAARAIKPDVAIGLDVILAGDTPDLCDSYQNALGNGPTVNLYNFHGRGTLNGMIPNENLVRLAEKAAEDNCIPHQRFSSLGIITESAYIQMEFNGIVCIDLGLPARYTHSPIEVVSLLDIVNLGKLVASMITELKAGYPLTRYTLD
jgi:putative aminopeptidase FrvX